LTDKPSTLERNKLILENRGLVGYIIKRYVWPGAWDSDGNRQDLYDAGMAALVRASQQWSGRGIFSAYAGKAIQNACLGVIRKNRHQWDVIQALFADVQSSSRVTIRSGHQHYRP
jgi:DNA-directed RNA polymerase specialized sigma subunit